MYLSVCPTDLQLFVCLSVSLYSQMSVEELVDVEMFDDEEMDPSLSQNLLCR